MKFVVWGAGNRGGRLIKFLKPENVEAIVDGDEAKWGTRYKNIPIIGFSDYKEKYSEYFIVVTPLKEEEIRGILESNHIYQYFLLSECPAECQCSGDLELIQHLPITYSTGEKIGIYGITLFSLLVCQFLKENGCGQIYLFPQQNVRKELLSEVRERMPELDIVDSGDFSLVERLLLTVEKEADSIAQGYGQQVKIDNCFDFSDRMINYYNPKIEKFKGIHRGKRCFIVATGPSLRMGDLTRLHENGEISISMNRISCAFGETAWRPDYYVLLDPKGIESYGEEMCNCEYIKAKFISDYYTPFWDKKRGDSVYKFHGHWEWFKPEKPKFSEDISRKAYEGYTVTYLCLQLAVYMGFSEIYLLGVDFNYSKDMESEQNHFHKDYFGKGTKTGGFHKTENYLAYQKAEEYTREHGIKIYNATRGGELEVFERADFDSLF